MARYTTLELIAAADKRVAIANAEGRTQDAILFALLVARIVAPEEPLPLNAPSDGDSNG